MANYPSDLKYTKDHEWARVEGGRIRVGITQYAVDQLGDVTLVDLPAQGFKTEAHKRFGDIESVKTVSELFAPVSGEVVEVNEELANKPELVNENPYENGWLVVIQPASAKEVEELLSAEAYTKLVSELDH